jgi:hypothetical protein
VDEMVAEAKPARREEEVAEAVPAEPGRGS